MKNREMMNREIDKYTSLGLKSISLGEIEGMKVGNAQDLKGITGCTVAIFEEGAVAGVDVRGGAPGTRETDLLKSENLVDRVHGIILAGGSAFGLDAASGVMKYLEEKNIGFDVGVGKVPIVPGAVLFDLIMGDPECRPDAKMGYEAAKNAGKDFQQGSVGAGTGATVGKILGKEFAMKGGLGVFAFQIGDLKVGALVAVNAFGDIVKDGEVLAGVYDRKKNHFLTTEGALLQGGRENPFNGNTTIGIIVTNGSFSKPEMNKIASMAQNGYARAISPSHTMVDGDTVFAAATGVVKGKVNDVNLAGHLAALAMQEAIYRGIMEAETLDGVPGRSEMKDE